ncbi:MAG: type II toxin-antitoxin system RelE/ParE family toxin [Sphingobium sp.]|nr:type II toxin-antitoxin system RelE/ParE family toxin [Sphingobium sp.]
MQLSWTALALADREAIYDYIEADNPHAALALDELFTEKVSRLADHPSIGRVGRVPGTRELVAHQNYIIVYDVMADSIRILRILHAARQWPAERMN